jgi:hypothetical protein
LPLPDKSSQLTNQEKPVSRENGNIFINKTALREYLEEIPNGDFGNWHIDSAELSEMRSEIDKLKLLHSPFSFPETYVPSGWYKRLITLDTKEVMMSNTWAEIGGHYELFANAHGRVLINGLGLGIAAWVIDKIPEVDEVIVQEIDPKIIKWMESAIWEHTTKVEIFQGDAWKGIEDDRIRFDYIWHDIWPNYCSDNIQEFRDMRCTYLEHIKNPKRAFECQGCWSEELSHAMKWRGDFVENMCRTRIEED